MAIAGDLVTNLVVNSSKFGPGLNKARGDLSSFVSSAKRTIMPVAGLVLSTLSARASVNAARTQVGEEKKLEAVLKATGNAAQLSAQQIKDFAATRQDVTNFGDEMTIAGAGVLATFKEIKGPVFLDSIRLAQDMSSVMGQDLKGSIVQLGKALNDPIRGVSALSDVGVSFTQQQRDQIKALQESGDILGAQAIILAELRSEFGGAAEAMADPLTQLTNLIGDIGENIGFVLLPSIEELYAGFRAGLGPIAANVNEFKELGEWLAGGIRFVVSYGKHIVAAGIAIGGIVLVTKAWAAVTQAASKSLLLVQALSGPKGWATAAAGIALYMGAVYTLDGAYADVKQSMDAAAKTAEDFQETKEAVAAVRSEAEGLNASLAEQQNLASTLMGQYVDGADQLRNQLIEIQKLVQSGALSAEQGEQLQQSTVDRSTGIHSRIKDIRDEIALLKGETNEAALEISKFYEKGAPLPLLNDLQKAIELRNQLKRQQEDARNAEQERLMLAEKARQQQEANQNKGLFDELADAKKRAEGYLESLKTPAQRLQEDMEDYRLQLQLGNIDKSQYDQLVARRNEDFNNTGSLNQPSGPNNALDARSSEAMSLLARSFGGAGTVSVQERSARTQERIESYQRTIAERIERQNVYLAKIAEKKETVTKLS